MQLDELGAWLRLCAAPGIGNQAARRLLAAFGLPQEIFKQSSQSLQRCVTAEQAAALLEEPAELANQIERTWRWLQERVSADNAIQRRILTLAESDYPASLLNTEDPPILLYLEGASHWLRGDVLRDCGEHGLAMVGSRNPSAQGVQNARQFAQTLQQAGLIIISGLALGIDAAVHEGALNGAGGADTLDSGLSTGWPATIAVVGTGLDQVYPRANRDLAARILQDGIIISEYALGTPPLGTNFPKRNRIISGLALGTLVVEAAPASGSLITARMASEQGREVFAIPGSIHAPQSRGCHALIKQGAKLVESAQDVLEELRMPTAQPQQVPHKSPKNVTRSPAAQPNQELPFPVEPSEVALTPKQRDVLKALGFDPMGLDALMARSGYDAATLQVQLLELELEGLVARLPGGLFQRLGAA